MKRRGEVQSSRAADEGASFGEPRFSVHHPCHSVVTDERVQTLVLCRTFEHGGSGGEEGTQQTVPRLTADTTVVEHVGCRA